MERGFAPNVINLDKDITMFNAVREGSGSLTAASFTSLTIPLLVWPEARPQISQSYLMQALSAQARNLGFTVAQNRALASTVLEFQRLKNYSEVLDYEDYFFRQLLKLVIKSTNDPEHARPNEPDMNECDKIFEVVEQYETLKGHFQTQWLSPQWLREYPDVSLVTSSKILV